MGLEYTHTDSSAVHKMQENSQIQHLYLLIGETRQFAVCTGTRASKIDA